MKFLLLLAALAPMPAPAANHYVFDHQVIDRDHWAVNIYHELPGDLQEGLASSKYYVAADDKCTVSGGLSAELHLHMETFCKNRGNVRVEFVSMSGPCYAQNSWIYDPAVFPAVMTFSAVCHTYN